MKNGNEIEERFGRSAQTYDESATVQKDVAERLVMLMSEHQTGQTHGTARVLEIGCGTGNLSTKAWQALQPKEMMLNDISATMLQRAQQKMESLGTEGAQVVTMCGDAEKTEWGEAEWSHIVSASAIQWFCNPLEAIKKAARALKAGGQMWVATYGPRTFRELRGGAEDNKNYPSLQEWEEAMEQNGLKPLHVSRSETVQSFGNRQEMLRMMVKSGIGSRRDSGESTTADARELTWETYYMGAAKPVYQSSSDSAT